MRMQCFRDHYEKVQDKVSGISKGTSLDNSRREAPFPSDDVIEWEVRESVYGTIL